MQCSCGGWMRGKSRIIRNWQTAADWLGVPETNELVRIESKICDGCHRHYTTVFSAENGRLMKIRG